MDAIEAAVAEDTDDVVRLQQRRNPLDNRSRVALIKGRPAGRLDRRDDCFGSSR